MGEGVGHVAVLEQGGEDLRRVYKDADGERFAPWRFASSARSRAVQVVYTLVEVAGLEAALRAPWVDLEASTLYGFLFSL
jgi:hypothetical protein